MHIEKVSFFDNEIFGTVAIPMKKGIVGDVVGNEDNTFINHDEDGLNHYTFIIGDNGVGKTNLLNSIANINHSSSRRMYYFDYQRDKQRKPYIKYVGSGLYSAENEYEELDVKIVNPNKINITRQLINLFYHYPKKVGLLEKQLGKSFDPVIELSINYRYETKERKQVYHIGSNNDLATQGIIKALCFQGDFGSIENYSVIKEKLLKTDSYKLLETQGLGPDAILREISCRQITQALISRLSSLNYDFNKNVFQRWSANVKQNLRSPFSHFDLQSTDDPIGKKELLFVMLLEEIGLLHINMRCEFPGGTCGVNSLSTGEKLMIKYFTIFSEITARRLRNIIFLCDEPENSLHPQWQKEFPQIMKTIIEDVYGIRNSHFIFTTHSPLIIMRSATLDNSFTLRMVRDEMGKIVIEPIDDVHQFSYENALLDVFDCSYYTKMEQSECEQYIKSDAERIKSPNAFRGNTSKNKLKEVSSSIDIFQDIENLYKSITNQE